jgi:hypothetical protein
LHVCSIISDLTRNLSKVVFSSFSTLRIEPLSWLWVIFTLLKNTLFPNIS